MPARPSGIARTRRGSSKRSFWFPTPGAIVYSTRRSASSSIPTMNRSGLIIRVLNRNLLARINRELGASFDPDAFDHRAVWNEAESRIEMHLVSSRDQTARIGSRTIVFTEGEVIHTENSHKYRPESFEALVERGGWRVKTVWTSDAPSFGVFLLDTEGAEVVVERQSPVKIESS